MYLETYKHFHYETIHSVKKFCFARINQGLEHRTLMVVHSYIIKLLSIVHGICKSFHYRFSIADLFFKYLLEKHLENRYLGVELNDQ